MMRGGWFGRIYRNEPDVKPEVSWRLLLRVFAYARPYRWRIAGLLLTILLTAGLGLLNPLIFRAIIDDALPARNVALLNLLALGLVLIPLLSGGVRILQRKLNVAIGEGVIFDLRVGLYAHLQRMSLRFYTHTKTGELMSRLNNDVVGAQNAISNTIVSIVSNFVTVVATLLVMLSMKWQLTILGVLVLPLFIVIARRLGRRLQAIAREQMGYNAQMNAMMHETLNISGALLVKLFGRHDSEVEQFERRAADVRDAGIRRAVLGSQFFVLMGLVGVIGTALVYWVGGLLVMSGEFSIGDIVAFAAYLTQLYGPLQALTNAPVDFAQSLVSFERVFEIIDLPLEITEVEHPRALQQVAGGLAFEDVAFRYDSEEGNLLTEVERVGRMDNVAATRSGAGDAGSARSSGNGSRLGTAVAHQARAMALESLSFEIAPGQLVALVGPSGAGKTTMTYLIPRLYDPTAGRITLDGQDLRLLSLRTLAENIGMVTQETTLFHDSIRTNLLYAKPDASHDEIVAAARAAHIHDFIMGLPEGYDSIVGERGYRLSGGEKQRIAIARVILKDPSILVLDEATSHLDSQSEALIQDALHEIQRGRTSIVIAHRLSTILAADMILVLDRGRIVERGRHEDLLAQGGLYATLYKTQFNPEQETA